MGEGKGGGGGVEVEPWFLFTVTPMQSPSL